MRRSLFAAVVTAALFAGACTDGAPVPTAPPAIPGPSFSHLTPTAFQIRDQITALFRKDLMQPLSSLKQQDYALSQFSKVERKMEAYNAATSEEERKLRLKEARFSAFALIVNAFIRFHKGDLVGGKTEDTKVKMIALDASVLRFVDFEEVPDLTTFAGAPSKDRVVTLVTAAPFTALPESKAFGMKGGQNCLPFGTTGFLVGSKIKTPEKVGDGPLPGGYRQFPTMVEWSLTRSDGGSGFDCEEGVLLGAVEVDDKGPDAKYHPVHSSRNSDGTRYFLPDAYNNDPTQRLRLAQLLNGSVVVHEPADASALGLEPSGATAFAPERTGSGMLAMARWGLKTALWQIDQFLSPKPAYAFTLLLGCRTKRPTGSSSKWVIIDRYPPVAEVRLTSSSPTVNLGESVNLTVTQEDAYGVTLEDNTATPPHPVVWPKGGGAVKFTATSNGGATVEGTAPGTVTISATSEGIAGTVTVTVVEPIRVSGFTSPRARSVLLDPSGQAETGNAGTTNLVSDLQNTTKFGASGVVACAVVFRPFVLTVAAGSLVDATGRRLVDVFFGSVTATTLSPAEATELAAFVRAGGLLYVSGNSGGNDGPSYNPLFAALEIGDTYDAEATTGFGFYQSSDPPDNPPFTHGPFGTVGELMHTVFRPLTTSSLTALATGSGTNLTILAEGAFGAGRVVAAGDPIHQNQMTGTADPDNQRFFLNFFAHACPAG